MVISPHADDAAAFCGATLAKLASQGWRIVLVRVTDDCRDSVGLTLEEARSRNETELRDAAQILGVSEFVELGFETDRLADVSEVALRERIVYLFRKHRPYAVFSFDPFGLFEGNMDHVRVAQAVEEAFWVSCFDLHHPEHFKEGLTPFAACERWYFGRDLPHANHAEDITEHLEKRLDALCAHRTMMQNTMHQYVLQLETWGRRMAWIESSMNGDMRPLLALFLQAQAKAAAERFSLPEGRLAESFRVERFGGLEELFQAMSEKIPGQEEAPVRPHLGEVVPSHAAAENMGDVLPSDVHEKLRLMGHHHLCVGAFEELIQHPPFALGYAELLSRLQAGPDLLIETQFGYDVFCYACGYWSQSEGRCSTGWQNKISKDRAVLSKLGLKPGHIMKLGELQRLLAQKVTDEDLRHFCGPGEWACEFYLHGVCQRGFSRLREQWSQP
jgi:LmbE family N-acetylglucosaminyl deacetylase